MREKLHKRGRVGGTDITNHITFNEIIKWRIEI